MCGGSCRAAASGLTGKILLANVPVTSDGSTGWYQLVVGSGSLAKTYNFYTQQAGPSGSFTNIVSDGGASSSVVSGTPFIAQLNLSSGGSITYAPDYWLSANPQAGPPPLPPPTAPLQKLTPVLVGDNDGGAFDALSVIAAGQPRLQLQCGRRQRHGRLQHRQDRARPTSQHPSWTLTPVVAQSDIYGRWSTAETTQFWDGTYTAYMEQFKPGNWALDRPVGYATVPVTFTVQLDKLPLTRDAGRPFAAALGRRLGHQGQLDRAVGRRLDPAQRHPGRVRDRQRRAACWRATARPSPPRSTTPRWAASARSPATGCRPSSSAASSTSICRPASSFTSPSLPATDRSMPIRRST